MEVENKNKEADMFTAAGNSAIYKAEKLKKAIQEELKKEGVKELVIEYIFGGVPNAISPLAEVRKANK